MARGEVWDVCVDLRRDSPTFGRWHGVTLKEGEHTLLNVAPGFGHGFVVLSDTAWFVYKCTREYQPGAERGIRWDDPDLAIARPLRDVLVSEKDRALPAFADADVFEAAHS